MTIMFPTITQPATIPPWPVTIHKEGACTVAFEDYGSVSITGPRRAELTGMVSALPTILRALVGVTRMLRARDGAASPHLAELEAALMDAGIDPDAPAIESQPMTPVSPASTAERFALLLGSIADKLDSILADGKTLRPTPKHIQTALADISGAIRIALRENPVTVPDVAEAQPEGGEG